MANEETSIQVRLVLAFALSFIIVLASRYFLAPTPNPAQQKSPAAGAKQSASAPSPAPAPSASPAAPTPPPPEGSKQGTAEQQITVENALYKITLSSRGAMAKNWALKKYRDEQGNPLDLVDSVAAKQFGFPLSIWTSDDARRQQVNSALFVASQSGEIQAPATLVFEYSDSRITARKEMVFHENDYVVEVKTDLWVDGKPVPHDLTWRGGFGDIHDVGMRGNQVDVFYRDSQKMTRWTSSNIKTGELSASGPFPFTGIEDRFFTATFLPQSGAIRTTAFKHDVVVPEQQKPRPSIGMAVGSGDGPQNRLRIFVGPKEIDLLASIHASLPEVVDYGWFAFVAKPLFIGMRWIHGHIVANYGWTIILLTVFINFALFPLKVKSLRSTMKMQKVQPQVKAIQDKYKQYKMNDPRKAEMNKELMALYKVEGVNPVGGCLPMLIQLPFLYGFYKVLVVSIEMRHAPWIWWIHDLSAPETIAVKILPLAMCATQFILQRMSPSPSADPAQQKIMMFMPVMFLLMFWGLSSGLVLYWLTGNVVGIAQQWYLNRTDLQQAVQQKKAAKAGKKQALAKRGI